MTYIKNKDFDSISNFVHEKKGLRFSPYEFESRENLTFDKTKLRHLCKMRININGYNRWCWRPTSFNTIRIL